MDINFTRRHMSVPPHITAGQNEQIHEQVTQVNNYVYLQKTRVNNSENATLAISQFDMAPEIGVGTEICQAEIIKMIPHCIWMDDLLPHSHNTMVLPTI